MCSRARENERADACRAVGPRCVHLETEMRWQRGTHDKDTVALSSSICVVHACMPAFRIPMCTAAHHRLTTNGSHTITRPFLTPCPSLQKVHYRHIVFRQSLIGRVAHHITSSSDRSTLRRSLLSALNLLAAQYTSIS